MKCMIPLLVAVAGIGFVAQAAESSSSPLAQTRSTLEQWVQTRQLISQTRADWQADKETLEQTVALYERELKAIEDQMSKVATNNTQVAKEMSEAEALQKTSNETLGDAKQFATEFEAKAKQLVPQLPGPLQDILKPLLARLPADPNNTKMLAAERMQVLVGVLNELDKFNNAVNLFSERRKNDKGEEVSVQTVYIGLGAAYFVNEAGDFAGTGTADKNGWEWTTKLEIAPTVQEVVKIYRNERAARFVTLPAAVR
jgi:septal ring factor EnvC (AmiA/AmiB activator)